MFFCPTCKNTFDISKSITINTAAIGGANKINYNELIDNIIDEKYDENIIKDSDFNLNEITKNENYKKLKKNQKEFIINAIQNILPNSESNLDQDIVDGIAYFRCNNCSYVEPIPPKTKIYAKTVSNTIIDTNYKNMIYSNIIPYTRKYTCPNSKCESHTDDTKREAKFFRLNGTYKLKFICMACDTII